MSNKSVLGSPNVTYKGGKTTFPVSQDFTFTAAPGMLLPTYRQFLNIGEKISGCPKFFLRTNPLLAPSMTDLDVYVECFFVPMRHLFSMFEQWITQVSDAPTDLYAESSWENGLPVLRTSDSSNPFSWMSKTFFDYNLFGGYNLSVSYQKRHNTFGFGLHRLTQHLGYNPQALFINCASADYSDCGNIVPDQELRNVALSRSSSAIPPYFFAAYQKIYMDIYRDTQFESNNVRAYNMDTFFNQGNLILDPTQETINQPGIFGYPRLGLLSLRFRNRAKDYFTAIRPNPLFNSIGMLPDALNNLSDIQNWLLNDNNKQYFNDYEGGYNVALSGSNVDGSTLNDALNWRTGDVGTITDRSSITANSSIDGHLTGLRVTGSDSSSGATHTHNLSINSTAILSAINTASLRSAFAFEKLLQVTNRAGRHTDDQVLAQFGVKLPQGVSNETYKIKSYHTIVHIGEVISTAQTSVTDGETTSITPLGEMAGRGVAVLNSEEGFSFTAPTWGVFMCIFSVSPRYKYVGAIEKDGFKQSLYQFFRPQTDDLGQQPMFMDEMNSWIVGKGSGANYSERNGWQWRYMEDKIKFDRVSYAFLTNGDNPWSFCSAAPSYLSQPDKALHPIVPGAQYNMPDRKFFNKVFPGDLNKIFNTEYDGAPAYPDYGSSDDREDKLPYPQFLSAYLRDPFKVDFHMSAVKHSYMSRFGEPELGSI